MKQPVELKPEQLYKRCDPEQLRFETTADLADGDKIIGQDRAVQSIEFAIGIQHEGYNLFALGPNGTGKYTAVRRYLAAVAPDQQTPDDWCYVHNFEQPYKPRALRLPPGRSADLSQDMKRLVEELFTVLPAAFASDEYQSQRKVLEEEYKSQQHQALEELKQKAKNDSIALIQTPGGFAFAPLKDGEVVSPDEFLSYSPEDQHSVEQKVLALQEALQEIMRQVPMWQRELQNRVKELNYKVAGYSIEPLFEELHRSYSELPPVLEYLAAARADIVENVEIFLDDQQSPGISATGLTSTHPEGFATRYQVNVMVDNGATDGAPVVLEGLPRYQNLIGRLEHVSQMGTLLTDFTLIKPGALHRANGGYLVLDALALLKQPYAWDGLKLALTTGQLQIESLGQAYSLISTVSLEPEPIPLATKVILVGERRIYYLLSLHDPEFAELFKVAADFEDDMPRTQENVVAFAQLMSTLVRKEGLRHFERQAVARVIEYSSRWAGDAEKLSVHMQTMSDLLREADYWAANEGHELVSQEDVQQALDAQIYRASRVRDQLQEGILREAILIDTDGAVVGQINGLAVYQMGRFAFGKPNRITAQVRLGKGEVIDIERQSELGGPIHSKGVMILGGFLGGRYAADRPLPLSATLVFEQSYHGVEGDSASSAELYAILSVLAQAPIRQSIAVTGSVNQHGQVQAIGGVNEKIESFFDVCEARGLSGEQGVVIPTANVDNLMLRGDVVDAVAAGRFHIYAVDSIDQGIEILTGVPAGELNEEGNYPGDSINGRVVAYLERLIENQRMLSAPPPKNGDQAKENARDE